MNTVKLANGVEMPLLGYGTMMMTPEETKTAVLEAIDLGYRNIDTAQAYYNEEGVGAALTETTVPREDLFVTTKVWIANAGETAAAKSIDESLTKLQTNYIDLLLIHQPYGDYYGTWRAMEKAYRDGKVRAIGVCNQDVTQLIDFATFNEIAPMVNQLETHVFNQQRAFRPYLAKFNTQIEGWSPLAQAPKELAQQPTLVEIAQKYQKSPAQVALRFLVQDGVPVIPKSSHRSRMIENISIFDFALTDSEMDQVRSLDQETPRVFDFTNPQMVEGLFQNFNLGNNH